MSVLPLLLGLLVLAYVGSALGEGSAAPRAPVAGYLGLGFLAGPHGLGFIDALTVEAFDPIARAGLGWLAFTHGVAAPARQASRTWHQLPISLAFAATAAVVGAAVSRLTVPSSGGLQPAALLGLAAVGALASSRFTDGHAPPTRFSPVRLGGGLVGFALLDLMFVVHVVPADDGPLALAARVAVPAALGLALGVTIVAARRAGLEPIELRAMCIGTTAIAIATSMALGVPAITTAFVLGLTLRHLAEPDHGRDRATYDPIVGGRAAVVLPMVVLAGLALPLPDSRPDLVLTGVVVLALVAFDRLLRRGQPGRWRPPQSEAALSLGFAAALQLEGEMGQVVLLVAAGFAVVTDVSFERRGPPVVVAPVDPVAAEAPL